METSMIFKRGIGKWILAATVPIIFGAYYGFALSGAHARAQSPEPVVAQDSNEAPLVTGLPDFTRLVERYGPSVVNVSVTGTKSVANALPLPGIPEDSPFYDFFRRFGMPAPSQEDAPIQRGEGSGFIVSSDGVILTNAHVVGKSSDITVKLTDRREFPAKVIGIDETSDVAVLRIDAHNLPAVKVGDANKLKVGEWVVAIGSPFGFENTVTSGIVSGKSRTLPDGQYVPFIQTDVAVNPGNSGGPLFNMKGEVVGINSQIFSRTGGYMGLSFAIPIDVAINVKDQLIAHGSVTRGRIGVRIQEVDQTLANSFHLPQPQGALVSQVEPGSPAEKAGIRSGDIIIGVDGKTFEQMSQLPAAIAAKMPGANVQLDIWRDGKKHNIDVTVGSFDDVAVATSKAAEETKTSNLGLALRDLTPEEKSQLKSDSGVYVESANGPAASAGLRHGDVILAVGPTPVKSVDQLIELTKKSGKTVALLVQRNELRSYVPIPVS
jgi:serine protease Do